MDTREKIVRPGETWALVADGDWLVLRGTFDPLTAAEAGRIERLARGRRVLAIVDPGDDPLLPAEARAALIAALRDVHAVCIGDATDFGRGIEIVSDPEGDGTRTAEFVAFVVARQNA